MFEKICNVLIFIDFSVGSILLLWRETYQLGINFIVLGLFIKEVKNWK